MAGASRTENGSADRTAASPFVLGLAGGIGSGKSTIARAFADLGCVVVDFDREIGRALQRPDVVSVLREWWGDGVLAPDGGLDRGAIGRIVFDHPEERKRLEGFLHPMVWVSRDEARRLASEADAPGTILDAPLLFEAGLDAECDAVAFVDAPPAIRAERVSRSRGWSAEELEKRENAQTPIDDKRSRSRFIIHNGGSGEPPFDEVRRVFDILCGG